MTFRNLVWRAGALLTALSMSFAATAQSDPAPTAMVVTEHARASLILSADRVKPGETIWAALRVELDPGWHTYWRNPGDSGLPGSMTWTLPDGVKAGDIQWPAPKRIPYGPLMNFGFDDLVVLPMPVTIAEGTAMQTMTIDAVGDWLVCAEICIPDRGEFRVSLIVDPSQPTQRSSDAAEIDAALAGLPKPAPWPVALKKKGDIVSVVAGPGVNLSAQANVEYFPHDSGLIDNAAEQTVALTDGQLRLDVAATPAPMEMPAQTGGVLVIADGGQRQAYTFAAAAPGVAATSEGTMQSGADVGLWLAIILAFAGGLILNLMPCVLPVLAMKAFAFAGHGSGAEHASARRRDGIAYTLGVMTTFGILAGVLVALRSAGSEIGWGFQLQSPAFVAVIAYVLLALGLNLSGVFAIGAGVMGAGESLAQKGGATGAFFTGALAVVVATPCTAPFMGAAVGYAMTQPPAVTLVVFQALALGLAAPFLLLSLVPRAARMMPKPGAWMNRLKEVLAFPMYASAAWMVWVLAQQVGPEGLAAGLAGLIFVALAAWLAGQAQNSGKVGISAALAVVVLAGALGLVASVANSPGVVASNASPSGTSEPYSPERVAQLRAEGRAVFVNYTAAWCITCLMNERVALSTKEVKEAFAAGNYVYLKADWTNRDAGIAKALAAFGRSGVPLYVVYRPGDARAEVLPQLLTPGLVVAALKGPIKP